MHTSSMLWMQLGFENLVLRNTNSRIEATMPVNIALLDVSTNIGRVLGYTTGCLIFSVREYSDRR